MAVNNISQNRLSGEIQEEGKNHHVSIERIVESVNNDISHLRNKMENLPPFPDGKSP